MDRRKCLGALAGIVGSAFLPCSRADANNSRLALLVEKPESDQIAKLVQQFLDQFGIPSLSMAIARDGQFLYRDAFGYADTSKRISATPEHAYRIASVSKTFTATAIFQLIERGAIGLSDKVFGAGGILEKEFGTDLPVPVNEATVYHLLTHTTGGWKNKKGDPMFSHPAYVDHHRLIAMTLANHRLDQAPGRSYNYSNFGYCVLGRVIETVSGEKYDTYVKKNVLERAGITGMQIAGDTLDERLANEVVYYDSTGADPYSMAVRRMDSHGGWLATPNDLVLFGMAVTAQRTNAPILRTDSLRSMMSPCAVNPSYACGWMVNSRPNWWHTGSLPGTSSILVRTASGFCWAAIANARAEGIAPALDRLMWKIVKTVPGWQANKEAAIEIAG